MSNREKAGNLSRRKEIRKKAAEIKKKKPQNKRRHFEEIIDKFSQPKIMVIGDYISDVYVYGKPFKLSREAPVVVIRHERESIVPGGAGNAANNLASLGCQVYSVGILGNDEVGNNLLDQLKGKGVNVEGLLFSHIVNTISKTRIMAGDEHTSKQQVIRIDKVNDEPIPTRLQEKIFNQLERLANKADAVVVSDYGYGVVSGRVISFLQNLAIIDTPGMLDSITERDRGYNYQEVIGDLAQIAAKAGVMHDLPGGEQYGGAPATNFTDAKRSILAAARLPEMLGAHQTRIGQRGPDGLRHPGQKRLQFPGRRDRADFAQRRDGGRGHALLRVPQKTGQRSPTGGVAPLAQRRDRAHQWQPGQPLQTLAQRAGGRFAGDGPERMGRGVGQVRVGQERRQRRHGVRPADPGQFFAREFPGHRRGRGAQHGHESGLQSGPQSGV